MRYLIFAPRFISFVRLGTKLQTIRKRSLIRTGETISLRAWEGKAYRGPQEEIVPPVVCTGKVPIVLKCDPLKRRLVVTINGEKLTQAEIKQFIYDDGFTCKADFLDHWGAVDFEGVLITWREAS